jgi:hypothetical protein
LASTVTVRLKPLLLLACTVVVPVVTGTLPWMLPVVLCAWTPPAMHMPSATLRPARLKVLP